MPSSLMGRSFSVPLLPSQTQLLRASGAPSAAFQPVTIPPLTTILKTSVPLEKKSPADASLLRSSMSSMPKEYDPISKPFTSGPRGQGSCGSCWAQAIAGASADMLNRARIAKGDAGPSIEISMSGVMAAVDGGRIYSSKFNLGCCGGLIAEVVRDLTESGRSLVHPSCQDSSWQTQTALTPLCGDKRQCRGGDSDEAAAEFGVCGSDPSTNVLNQQFVRYNILGSPRESGRMGCYFGGSKPVYSIQNGARIGVRSSRFAKRYDEAISAIQQHIYCRGPRGWCYEVYTDQICGGDSNRKLPDAILEGFAGELRKDPCRSWAYGKKHRIYVGRPEGVQSDGRSRRCHRGLGL